MIIKERIKWYIIGLIIVITVPLIGTISINHFEPLTIELVISGGLGAYYCLCASSAIDFITKGKGWIKIFFALLVLLFPWILFYAIKFLITPVDNTVFASAAVGTIFGISLSAAKEITFYEKK